MNWRQRFQLLWRGYYEDGDFIVNRKYGRYPKRVAFKQGMTLYPQQEAYIGVSLGGYEIVEDLRGKRIKCLRCGSISFHPEDVEQRYCGHCHMFHVPIKDDAARA